jgi:hydrogenase/urease accessory protein HupE
MTPSTSFADAAVLAWLAVHAAIVASAVAARRTAPLWTVAVVWFYAFLGPVSNVVTSVGMPTCERFLYASVGGVALALGLALTRVPRGAWAATIVALLALAAGSVHRTRMWRSDDSLWAEVVPDHDSSRGNNYVAFGLREQALALRETAAKKPEGAERAEALVRADALLEQALGLVHRSIAQRYELEVRPRSVAEITRYSETLASEICHLLRRDEEALFHAGMASSVAGGPVGDPQFLDDVAEFDRAQPLLALGFAREAADAARRALKFGFRQRPEEIGALFLDAAALCEKDGMPAAAEACYVDAVAALKDGPERERARTLLYALRRRPRPDDVDATERSRVAQSEERYKRLRPRCPDLTYPRTE